LRAYEDPAPVRADRGKEGPGLVRFAGALKQDAFPDTLSEAVPCGILVLDGDGCVQAVNNVLVFDLISLTLLQKTV